MPPVLDQLVVVSKGNGNGKSHDLPECSISGILYGSVGSLLARCPTDLLHAQGGTETGTNYVHWTNAYNYSHLPATYRPDEPKSQVWLTVFH